VPPLYTASVPAARAALARALGLCARIGQSGGPDALLAARLAPGMFDCAGQLRCVAGFALCATFPLTGQPLPEPPHAPGLAGLVARMDQADAAIAALSSDAFANATTRIVRHRAGMADLAQTGSDYLHLFALPNLWFHLSMAYAILRAQGLPLGKADLDGLHHYPPG